MTKAFQKIILTAAAVFMSASIAFAALTIDAAKSQGLVGEKPDGLLGIVVATPSADVKTLVDTTNTERLKRYQDIAAKQGTQLEQVQAVAGQKLVSATPAGQYILAADGTWQKK
jgi:uncharacterized protein YdbL (DUF1318 family)